MQVFADLEENFGTYDKVAKAKVDIQSPNFPIRSKDKHESFNIFHTKFAAIIALLRYSDDYKIRNLRRYISSNLRAQITNSAKLTSYREFVTRLRTYNLDIK